MKFLLDTNFLVSVMKFRIDLFSELQKFGKPELCVLNLVVVELKKLAKSEKKNKKHARVALLFIKNKNVKKIKTIGSNTDEEILRIAKTRNCAVCTEDRELIKNLKKAHLIVICSRQKKYLVRV